MKLNILKNLKIQIYFANFEIVFYDDNDVPYTKETIQETETVNEYLVNDERVSIDIYENICSKYQYFKLFKQS